MPTSPPHHPPPQTAWVSGSLARSLALRSRGPSQADRSRAEDNSELLILLDSEQQLKHKAPSFASAGAARFASAASAHPSRFRVRRRRTRVARYRPREVWAMETLVKKNPYRTPGSLPSQVR